LGGRRYTRDAGNCKKDLVKKKTDSRKDERGRRDKGTAVTHCMSERKRRLHG